LFDDREPVPQNVIGIMNVKNEARVEELINAAKRMCNIKNALLIFRTNSSGNNNGFFDKVCAYLLNRDTVKGTKTAFVSAIDGTLFMQFNTDVD
jgi:hypothetical protein